jgi:mannose/fructose-specific phosphotransferase system component IIA
LAAVIIISHGNLAEAIVGSANMILRGNLEDVYHVCLKDDGIETFENTLKEIADEVRNKEVILMADIKGGSPFNTSLSVLRNHKYRAITGMNLISVIDVLMNRDHLSLDEIADSAVAASQESIEKIYINVENK